MPSLNLAGKFFSYLNMDYLIAPFLIRLIYWVGAVAIVSAGVGILFTSFEMSSKARVPLTIGATLLSLLLWRLLSEMLILAFNIYARLIEIRDLLLRRQNRMETQHTPPHLSVLRNQRLNTTVRTLHD